MLVKHSDYRANKNACQIYPHLCLRPNSKNSLDIGFSKEDNRIDLQKRFDMSDTEFKDKFIGFVDILGFKELVKAAEAEAGMSLARILEILSDLGSRKDRANIERYGPSICPKSTYIQRDLDFRLTQISDCAVISTEISPAGVINLISHCSGTVLRLLAKGILCRGYITRGSVFHTDTQFIGSGYEKASSQEKHVTAFRHENEKEVLDRYHGSCFGTTVFLFLFSRIKIVGIS